MLQACTVPVSVRRQPGHPGGARQHPGQQGRVGATQEPVPGCQHGAAGSKWFAAVSQRRSPAPDVASQQHDVSGGAR